MTTSIRLCAPGTIRLAVAAGFRDAHQLRTDTDLDSIRSRPDFQQLLMDLEFPTDPFTP